MSVCTSQNWTRLHRLFPLRRIVSLSERLLSRPGAWKPRSYVVVRSRSSLLHPMVGEAAVHVQGESLKTVAFANCEFPTPRSPGRGDEAMRVLSALVLFIVMILVVAALNGGNSSSSVVSVENQTLLSEDGVNDADWQRVKNRSGDVAAIIDLKTVTRDRDGNAHARLCLIKDGACPKGYRMRWYFDCRDHSYSWVDTDVLPQFQHEMKRVEPGSVADQLAALACASGNTQPPTEAAKKAPKWQAVPYPTCTTTPAWRSMPTRSSSPTTRRATSTASM